MAAASCACALLRPSSTPAQDAIRAQRELKIEAGLEAADEESEDEMDSVRVDGTDLLGRKLGGLPVLEPSGALPGISMPVASGRLSYETWQDSDTSDFLVPTTKYKDEFARVRLKKGPSAPALSQRPTGI